jgi:hypothetical protein
MSSHAHYKTVAYYYAVGVTDSINHLCCAHSKWHGTSLKDFDHLDFAEAYADMRTSDATYKSSIQEFLSSYVTEQASANLLSD